MGKIFSNGLVFSNSKKQGSRAAHRFVKPVMIPGTPADKITFGFFTTDQCPLEVFTS